VPGQILDVLNTDRDRSGDFGGPGVQEIEFVAVISRDDQVLTVMLDTPGMYFRDTSHPLKLQRIPTELSPEKAVVGKADVPQPSTGPYNTLAVVGGGRILRDHGAVFRV